MFAPLLGVPSLVSGLPRFQTTTGSRVVRADVVNGPGTVTSIPVRYLPPAPRPTIIITRHTPLPEAVPPANALLKAPGTKMSANRTGAAMTYVWLVRDCGTMRWASLASWS